MVLSKLDLWCETRFAMSQHLVTTTMFRWFVRAWFLHVQWQFDHFFTIIFLANPLKLCAVNSSNTWVLIVFIFVEFLSNYLASNTKRTKPSSNVQCTDNFI
jgi:hypothetical protein